MRDIRPSLIAALLAAFAGACSQQTPPSQPQAADTRFRAIYEAEWRWRKEQFPGGEDRTEPVADHLPRVDAASQEQRRQFWEDTLHKVDAVDRKSVV